MKRVIAGAAVVAALMSTTARAQDPPLLLRGPGSTIGVTVREVFTQTAPLNEGVYIVSVQRGQPADRAGLKEGDIVVEFDGERVRGVRNFLRLVQETPPGRTVKIVVLRAATRRTMDITPERDDRQTGMDVDPGIYGWWNRNRPRPDARPLPQAPDTPRFQIVPPPRGTQPRASREPRGVWRLGVELSEIMPDGADFFGTREGAVINSVERNSPAESAGLRAGDVIVAIDGRAVRRPAEVADAVRDASNGQTLTLKVLRDKKELSIEVKVQP